MITYAAACRDPNLFGPWFAGESWATWRVLDKALFGEPLNAAELVVFRDLTGRDDAPTEAAREAWIVAGRRAGKDVKAASIAVYLATIGAELHGYCRRLTRGERGVVQILAVDREQAQVAFRYCRSFFEQPILAKLLRRETADSLELRNGLAIEITTSDRRRVRGRTVLAAIFDEIAHWRAEDTTNPDREVYRAVRPAMITIPNAMLIAISSPHARVGLLWEKFNEHYGQSGSTLVVRAPTWVLNPTVPRGSGEIAEAYLNDPAWAVAEYGAEFRVDVESFVSLEVLRDCTDPEAERTHDRACGYCAFVDPSGGSSDSMTLGIAHLDDAVAVLDVIREVRPPFMPTDVVERFCAVIKAYGLRSVTGDRYAAEWVSEQFNRNGVTYTASELTKSEIYAEFLPMLNSRTAALLTHDRLQRQLLALERRATRGGRDVIDHPRGGRDDVSNAAAGALVLAQAAPSPVTLRSFRDPIEYPKQVFV